MATVIRPETSENNPYWISRHRYYELKHWVMQYPEWERYLHDFEVWYPNPSNLSGASSSQVNFRNPTATEVEKRESCYWRINNIRNTLMWAFDDINDKTLEHILEAIIHGWSYEKVKARYDIPCSKDYYYKRYRKFFWGLSEIRK